MSILSIEATALLYLLAGESPDWSRGGEGGEAGEGGRNA